MEQNKRMQKPRKDSLTCPGSTAAHDAAHAQTVETAEVLRLWAAAVVFFLALVAAVIAGGRFGEDAHCAWLSKHHEAYWLGLLSPGPE